MLQYIVSELPMVALHDIKINVVVWCHVPLDVCEMTQYVRFPVNLKKHIFTFLGIWVVHICGRYFFFCFYLKIFDRIRIMNSISTAISIPYSALWKSTHPCKSLTFRVKKRLNWDFFCVHNLLHSEITWQRNTLFGLNEKKKVRGKSNTSQSEKVFFQVLWGQYHVGYACHRQELGSWSRSQKCERNKANVKMLRKICLSPLKT